MTIREWLKTSEDPEKLRAFLYAVTGWSAAEYLKHAGEEPEKALADRLKEGEQAIIDHVPIQYVTGTAPFYGRDFHVDPRVLIPRFDTEILVEQSIRAIDDAVRRSKETPVRVLDLCTGSGCIGITLKLERPDVSVTLSDVSEDALIVARENAERLGAGVEFTESDLFQNINGTFDIIVSNPPYVSGPEYALLDPEVRDHEPELALYGGEDGLQYYNRIASDAKRCLTAGGPLLLEIGCNEAPAVRSILSENGYHDITVIRDLSGRDRVVKGVI